MLALVRQDIEEEKREKSKGTQQRQDQLKKKTDEQERQSLLKGIIRQLSFEFDADFMDIGPKDQRVRRQSVRRRGAKDE